MSAELVILRGLPGSGKTTFAKSIPGHKRVNKDDLRAMLDNSVFNKENESIVHQIQTDLILRFLRRGQSVIVDNTNLKDSGVRDLHRLAESVGDVFVNELWFDAPFGECMVRNAARVGVARVPDEAMKRMRQQLPTKRADSRVYYRPLENSGEYKNDPTLRRAVICDIDGTFSFIGDRSPYDASKSDETDSPNRAVISCLNSMASWNCSDIIFVSAREERDRNATIGLINKHLHSRVAYALFMRPTGDRRKDSIVKKELFYQHIAGKYYVEFVLDDRPSVCRMWRYELGLPVFQVNDKEF